VERIFGGLLVAYFAPASGKVTAPEVDTSGAVGEGRLCASLWAGGNRSAFHKRNPSPIVPGCLSGLSGNGECPFGQDRLNRLVACFGPHQLTDAGPNETANSALVRMAKFWLALITIALVALIGAFVFAAFTL
jgi:hypothetical protein